MSNKSEEVYYCPLLQTKIELGLCLDINYERKKLFKIGILEELGKSTDYTNEKCEKCPHNPFRQ